MNRVGLQTCDDCDDCDVQDPNLLKIYWNLQVSSSIFNYFHVFFKSSILMEDMAANTCELLEVAVRTERCCITPLAYKKMSKAQREGYPEEGWTAYAVRKEKEMEELHTLVTSMLLRVF